MILNDKSQTKQKAMCIKRVPSYQNVTCKDFHGKNVGCRHFRTVMYYYKHSLSKRILLHVYFLVQN